MNLCLHDLAELTGGTLRLAAMPPRDGELALIRRIVLFADAACAGDVYWCLNRQDGDVDLAFLRGALGVVAAGPPIEPWAGRFSLRVSETAVALAQLADHRREWIVEPLWPEKDDHFLDPPRIWRQRLGIESFAIVCRAGS